MGRQINFYMIGDDEDHFLEFLFQNPDVTLLYWKSKLPNIETIDLNEFKNSKNLEALIWNRNFDIREEWISKGIEHRYDPDKLNIVETGKPIYGISISNAPVIEFSRSFLRDDHVLVRGRIWAEMNYLKDGALYYKGNEFKEWYTMIARWLQKNLKK